MQVYGYDFYKIDGNGEQVHIGYAHGVNANEAWEKLNWWSWAKDNGVEGKSPYSDDITFISHPLEE